MLFLLYSLGFILTFVPTIVQSAGTSYGPFYFPNSSVQTVQMYYGLVNSTTMFFNWQITGNYWFGVGFAASGQSVGKMYGVDAFIYGNYGGGGTDYTVYEWNLGNHTIGDMDVAQQIDFSVYRANNYHSIHLTRLLNTGTRYNYAVTMSGTMCLLWAIGKDIYVSDGHGTVQRGMNCTNLGGTTKHPTPSPTWWPINAPTTLPTSQPTFPPILPGITPYPTNMPTPKPTPNPTLAPTTKAPTTSAPTFPVPTLPPTLKPTPRPTLHPVAFNVTIAYTPPPTDVPTQLVQLTQTAATVQHVVTNNSTISNLDIIIIIIVAVFLCCLLLLAFLLYRRSEKKRQEKQEERKKNLLEVEKYKEQYGLNINKYDKNEKTQNGTKYDKDDDDDDDDNDEENPVKPKSKPKTEIVYENDRDEEKGTEDNDEDIVLPVIKPTPNEPKSNLKANKNVPTPNANKYNKYNKNNAREEQKPNIPEDDETPLTKPTKPATVNTKPATVNAKPQPIAKPIQASNTLQAKPKKSSKFSKVKQSNDW